MAELPVEFMQECWDYNPLTGLFVWRVRPLEHFANKRAWVSHNKTLAGRLAGDKKTQYVRLSVGKGRSHYRFPAHYAAWYISGMVVPDGMVIDHINGDRHDNSLDNLRVCSPLLNAHNRGRHKRNTSGRQGVYATPGGRWVAKVMFDGERIHCGTFDTEGEAIAARQKAEEDLLGDFARVGQPREYSSRTESEERGATSGRGFVAAVESDVSSWWGGVGQDAHRLSTCPY